jgi:hypothetical protein
MPSYVQVCEIRFRDETIRPVAFFDNGEIVRVEGRVGTREQVTGPGGDALIRLFRSVVAVVAGIEAASASASSE